MSLSTHIIKYHYFIKLTQFTDLYLYLTKKIGHSDENIKHLILNTQEYYSNLKNAIYLTILEDKIIVFKQLVIFSF
jgi:hypothetical protein